MQQALLNMGVMDAAAAASLIKNVDSDGDGHIRCARRAPPTPTPFHTGPSPRR